MKTRAWWSLSDPMPVMGLVGVVLAMAIPALAPARALAQSQAPWAYPEATRGEVVDEYHGNKVADPYRWLEEYKDDTLKWIEDQNKLTFGYLESIPQRKAILDRLTKMQNFERYGFPYKEGANYFYSKNDGLQPQSVLYTTTDLKKPGRVLLDPNTLTKDGTVAIAGTAPSHDGKLFGWSVADGGSDWQVWRVRDVESGQDLADEIKWIKFGGISWSKDNKGFYYSRFPEPEKGQELLQASTFQKIYYHTLGTPQSDDQLIYERPDQSKWYIFGGLTEDCNYLILSIESGETQNNALFFKPVNNGGAGAGGNAPVVELLNKFDAEYGFIGNNGPVFYLTTTLNSPKRRVIAIDTSKENPGDPANWTELLGESSNTLTGVSYVGGKFFCNYLSDAQSLIEVREPESGALAYNVDLPAIGTAGGFGGRVTDTETFYSFSNYLTPGTIYRLDTKTGKSSPLFVPKVDFDASPYDIRQEFAVSKDGTRVPMFIVVQKNRVLDGSMPCLLYGYGGFNISLTPGFSISPAVWMEMGGVYVVANLRGGGEYGKDWHLAGTKLTKQNVFDDFIACAEHLVQSGYASSKTLAIQGGSNGGLLVGACMIQRPDLFGACLPAVGVMDMLRFHKFTVGWGWVPDYGSSDDAKEFEALLAYSPYHNAKAGVCYPPTLITTADRDDRVVPAHSFKFAAAMQHAQAKDCASPMLIRIETRAGHGAGKPTAKRLEETADIYGFLAKTFGMDPQWSESAETK
jgi:prolyl oligopeptidase